MDSNISPLKGIYGTGWERKFTMDNILDFARMYWFIDMQNSIPWLFFINPWTQAKRSVVALGPSQVEIHSTSNMLAQIPLFVAGFLNERWRLDFHSSESSRRRGSAAAVRHQVGHGRRHACSGHVFEREADALNAHCSNHWASHNIVYGRGHDGGTKQISRMED